MASENRNRGKEGRDDFLFGHAKMIHKMREAIVDVNYLLSRGFSEKSSIQLVGNRYKLNNRQQKAVRGMSASNIQINQRMNTQKSIKDLENEVVALDGFNVLIIIESLLSNAYVFKGLDGCYRDLSGIHGTYKKVRQTEKGIELIADIFTKAKVKNVIWVFDKPVSNSGRMKCFLEQIALENNYSWDIILENNPDKWLMQNSFINVSSDALILDNSKCWFNLIEEIIGQNNLFSPLIISAKESL